MYFTDQNIYQKILLVIFLHYGFSPQLIYLAQYNVSEFLTNFFPILYISEVFSNCRCWELNLRLLWFPSKLKSIVAWYSGITWFWGEMGSEPTAVSSFRHWQWAKGLQFVDHMRCMQMVLGMTPQHLQLWILRWTVIWDLRLRSWTAAQSKPNCRPVKHFCRREGDRASLTDVAGKTWQNTSAWETLN